MIDVKNSFVRVVKLGVDAGSIWIATAELLEKYGLMQGDADPSLVYFIPCYGRGTVKARTSGWNGSCSAQLTANTNKGFYVGDLCYIIRDEHWDRFCNECLWSGHERRKIKGLATVNTGGDGGFNVTISFIKK